MSGASQPASSIRCLISGTAAAASGRLTVTRTISEPASASSMHCRAVAFASAVSVIVIDWTTIGAPPPTWTWPTFTATVRWSFNEGMESPMVASRAMKAIRVHEYGGPAVLTLEDIPDPRPGPGEVVVRVRAAGVNPVDAYMHGGAYARKPPLPYT